MKRQLIFGAFGLIYLANAGLANAVSNTNFPSCISPSGTVVASYDNGTHGIVDIGSKIGKDVVYSQGEGNVMQCFCGEDGKGIQTNWLNASGLTEDEMKVLQNDGWILVPDGSAWGLGQGAYLAKNSDYTCSSTTTSGGGDGRTDGRSDGRGSIVQSAAGSLASTGNILFILEVFGVGLLLSLIGLTLRFKIK